MGESFGYAKAIEGDNGNVRVIMVNGGLAVSKPKQYDLNKTRFELMKASTGVGFPLGGERNLNKKQYDAVVDYLT
jgi:hypothetical protein